LLRPSEIFIAGKLKDVTCEILKNITQAGGDKKCGIRQMQIRQVRTISCLAYDEAAKIVVGY
jgi:hypothetical protein